jgi:hypothetical protein
MPSHKRLGVGQLRIVQAAYVELRARVVAGLVQQQRQVEGGDGVAGIEFEGARQAAAGVFGIAGSRLANAQHHPAGGGVPIARHFHGSCKQGVGFGKSSCIAIEHAEVVHGIGITGLAAQRLAEIGLGQARLVDLAVDQPSQVVGGAECRVCSQRTLDFVQSDCAALVRSSTSPASWPQAASAASRSDLNPETG